MRARCGLGHPYRCSLSACRRSHIWGTPGPDAASRAWRGVPGLVRSPRPCAASRSCCHPGTSPNLHPTAHTRESWWALRSGPNLHGRIPIWGAATYSPHMQSIRTVHATGLSPVSYLYGTGTSPVNVGLMPAITAVGMAPGSRWRKGRWPRPHASSQNMMPSA
jgi:hypothetical protein